MILYFLLDIIKFFIIDYFKSLKKTFRSSKENKRQLTVKDLT